MGVRVPAWRWIAAAVVATIALFLAAQAIELADIRTGIAASRDEPLMLAAAAIGYSMAFALRAFAWRILLDGRTSTANLFLSLQTSTLLNHLLPLKAGEIARPYLATKRGVPSHLAISSSIVARALDFLALAVIACVTVPAVQGRTPTGTVVQAATAVIFAGALALLVYRARPVPSFMPGRIRAKAESLQAGLREIPLRRVALVSPVVLLSWVLEAGVLLAASQLVGTDVALRVAIGATAFTILFQVIHLTPGGIGVYEAAMTAVLVSQGVAVEEAATIAVLTHVLKFAYSFTVGGACALVEVRSLRRQSPADRHAGPREAGRFEIVMARLWNVVNEGKPFTVVFTFAIVAIISLPNLTSPGAWGRHTFSLAVLVPLFVVFYRFDFPLRLRLALWVFLAAFVAITRTIDPVAVGVTLALYFGFTVVLWGTIYYHLRIGTKWTNGFRFVRLVAENPDPTSGNMLEQLPKVLLLVLAFQVLAGDTSSGSIGVVLGFTVVVGVAALLLHQWFFTWVPALPQPRIAIESAPLPNRTSRRVIAIVIDGCRADRLAEANTPVIDELRARGTEFTTMSTVYPARTVTCFSSMLTGASPEVHGMHSNFVPSLGVKCESLFDSLRAAGLNGKLVGIAHLVDAFGHEDVHSVTAVMDNDEIDDALIARGKEVLMNENPDLLVLQLLSVDQTGHARGSYNAEYLHKIEETDAKIGEFLAWCEANGYLDGATLMLTADHGQGIGIGGHGHMTPPEIRIPCILAGESVAADVVRTEPRFITDFTPTIANLLGVAVPSSSVGRSLVEPATAERKPAVFVIPAHNEATNLPAVLARVEAAGIPGTRVVVVDDGSTDDTAAVARAHGAIVYSHPLNRGLGAALRSGLAVARGLDPRVAIYLDADGEYDPIEAARLIVPIEAGDADYVLGSRFRGSVTGMTMSRRMANAGFSGLLSILCGRRISDGQTGFRAFSPRALDVAEIIHDYNYAQVLTLDLLHKGMRLREVPITYTRRTSGRSFISAKYLWRVPAGMMREMLHG